MNRLKLGNWRKGKSCAGGEMPKTVCAKQLYSLFLETIVREQLFSLQVVYDGVDK